MSSMQQSLDADQTKGLTQARTEEWMEVTNEPRDILPSDSAQAQLSAHPSDHQQEPASFLQQTGEKMAHVAQDAGEKMAHVAQDAVETVKEKLGMNDKK